MLVAYGSSCKELKRDIVMLNLIVSIYLLAQVLEAISL